MKHNRYTETYDALMMIADLGDTFTRKQWKTLTKDMYVMSLEDLEEIVLKRDAEFVGYKMIDKPNTCYVLYDDNKQMATTNDYHFARQCEKRFGWAITEDTENVTKIKLNRYIYTIDVNKLNKWFKRCISRNYDDLMDSIEAREAAIAKQVRLMEQERIQLEDARPYVRSKA